jgi:hypothetical protein
LSRIGLVNLIWRMIKQNRFRNSWLYGLRSEHYRYGSFIWNYECSEVLRIYSTGNIYRYRNMRNVFNLIVVSNNQFTDGCSVSDPHTLTADPEPFRRNRIRIQIQAKSGQIFFRVKFFFYVLSMEVTFYKRFSLKYAFKH